MERAAGDAELISIRGAARRLGVHENTIRRLIDRGLLEFIRLPGSGYRRLAQADVERLRLGMRLNYAHELNVAATVDAQAPRKYAGGIVPVSRKELASREGLE